MDAESFEVQGTAYLQEEDRNALIQQVSEELIASSPSFGYKVKFHGEDQMTVVYHCFEMDLPSRIQIVEEQADKLLKDWEKYIKKEFKKRGGGTLKMKEVKDLRDRNIEKVSLNNRYYFRASRTYDLS
jgi:hypothetical protein